MKIHCIKHAFNKAESNYDTACDLQLRTGEYLIQLLKNHGVNYETMLDAGCGTGIVTQKLAAAMHFENLYAVDIADKLIERAKQKLDQPNIFIQQSDFNNLTIKVDCAYSNLALHWSLQFVETLSLLKDNLNPDGVLAFSIPVSGTFKEIEDDFSIHPFLENTYVMHALKTCGYDVVHSETQIITYTFDHILQALHSIKSVGANHVFKENKKPIHLHKLRKILSAKNENFNLSYHIGYFIVKKY